MKRKKIALIKAGMAAAAAIAGAVLLLFGSVELYRAGGSLLRMLSRNSEKYEYVPDVSHIMRQAGFSMDLIEILAEPVSAKAGRKASGSVEPAFVPEVFFYFKNDING